MFSSNICYILTVFLVLQIFSVVQVEVMDFISYVLVLVITSVIM